MLTAVLGPTNTGKTHLAIERMMGYETGMIGFPLRLLAREVYDRVVRLRGKMEVALVTGEEKIIPPSPRFYICTVEAMPVSLSVEFLAVDEIQLAADAERGHVFTDRILHARGTLETMLLGAATMTPLIRHLLPKAHIITRPRLSTLSYAGPKKLSRLPRRTAVTSFSIDSVYAIAEVVRQQKGGAAVVMGALSPRTRNAQVQMYQSGEVDYMVATDAIGMGLNMDVDHVAFAQTRKFDGRKHRELAPAELAQVAGRAGRHTSDGTFGVTGELSGFEEALVEQIENHEFEPVRQLMWRNPNLDFSSLGALKLSLEAPAPKKGLMRAPVGVDMQALTLMTADPQIVDRVGSEELLRLLWEVAQIPDFRKTMASEHAAILSEIFTFLTNQEGYLPADWLAERIDRCDRTDGDLDTLSSRLAHIRTWTYVSQKNGWLEDSDYWRKLARGVEDKLSDALHEGLMKQFVDRKSSALLKRLQGKDEAMATIDSAGDIHVEGEYAGRLDGLGFTRDPRMATTPARNIRAAMEKLVGQHLRDRANQLAGDDNSAFSLNEQGEIFWQSACVAKLIAGRDMLTPDLQIIADESLNGRPRQQVEARLTDWLRHYLDAQLEPLVRLKTGGNITGLARGLAFQLVEHGGHMARHDIADMLKEIDQPARATLRQLGVRFGAYTVFLPALLKPAPARCLAMLWSIMQQRMALTDLQNGPAPGLTSCPRHAKLPTAFYHALGFRVCGDRIIRFDMLERLADLIRAAIDRNGVKNGFEVTPDMLSLMGCGDEQMGRILIALGYVGKAAPISEQVSEQVSEEVSEDVSDKETEKEKTADKPRLIWKPDLHRRNANRPAKSAQPRKAKQKAAKKDVQKTPKSAKKSANKSASRSKVNPRKPAPIDPNSPFAVLEQLKNNAPTEGQ